MHFFEKEFLRRALKSCRRKKKEYVYVYLVYVCWRYLAFTSYFYAATCEIRHKCTFAELRVIESVVIV